MPFKPHNSVSGAQFNSRLWKHLKCDSLIFLSITPSPLTSFFDRAKAFFVRAVGIPVEYEIAFSNSGSFVHKRYETDQ